MRRCKKHQWSSPGLVACPECAKETWITAANSLNEIHEKFATKKKQKLLKKLREYKTCYGTDVERAHVDADFALLEYIDDAEIAEAWDDVPKYYA